MSFNVAIIILPSHFSITKVKEKENNEVILGFLSTFSKNEEKQEYYKKIGKELFKKLKKK